MVAAAQAFADAPASARASGMDRRGMIRFFREFRLIPIVLIATVALFALKTIGLLLDGGYTLGCSPAARRRDADITGTIPPPAVGRADRRVRRRQAVLGAGQCSAIPDITGSVGASAKTAEARRAAGRRLRRNKPEEPPKGPTGWKPVSVEPGRRSSPAERAILERLQERRPELDARAKELEMRESLLKAAEKRLEARVIGA